MKAAVLYEYGQPLVVEEVELDPPKAGEVHVRVAAAGVCRSDLHVMKGEATSSRLRRSRVKTSSPRLLATQSRAD